MKKILSIIIFLAASVFILPSASFSQEEGSTAQGGVDSRLQSYEVLVPVDGSPSKVINFTEEGTSLGVFINEWYTRSISIVAVFAVLIIIFYGFQYSFSETIFKKTIGRDRIQLAVGGLLLLIVAVVILQTINVNLINIGSLDKVTVQSDGGDFGLTSDSDLEERLLEARNSACPGLQSYSCDSEAPRAGSQNGNNGSSATLGGVNHPDNQNESSPCYTASVVYCTERGLNQGRNRLEEELSDWRREACTGVNAPCTIVNEDAEFDLGPNPCSSDQSGGNCVINSGLFDILNGASERLTSDNLVCTECGAPTVAHDHQCHAQVTCGDVRSNDVDVNGKLDRFTAIYAAGGFPVLEVQNDGEQRRIIGELEQISQNNPNSQRAQFAELLATKVTVISGISAEHFSVYSKITDADESAGLDRTFEFGDPTTTDWDL